MPVTCKRIAGKIRVIGLDGAIETSATGTAVDGGGHRSWARCRAQAMAINAGLDESVRFLEATRTERAFNGAVNRELRAADKLSDEAIRQVVLLLRQAREKIAARIATASAFDAAMLPSLKGEVERILREFQTTYRDAFERMQLEIEDAATALVREPILRLGMNIGPVSFPNLPTEITTTLANFHADQIKNVTNEAIQKITTQLDLGILGGASKDTVIKNIAEILPSRGNLGSTTARATRIVRTEANRIHSITTQARMEQSKVWVPDLRKYWLPAYRNTRDSHLKAGVDYGPDNAIGVDEYFIVGGFPAKYPRDPALPAEEVVNCQCRAVPVITREA
jgi:hypothetical protein